VKPFAKYWYIKSGAKLPRACNLATVVRAEERPNLALADEPEGGDAPKPVLVREDVVWLVRAKRYEEALEVLYRARTDSPGDRELASSIVQIKEFLIGSYAKRLGGLDRVAGPIPMSAVRSPDAMLLARYIDGTSTFGDVAQMSPLGQLRTLKVLVGLYSGDAAPASQPPQGAEPSADDEGRAPPPASAPLPISTRVFETEDDKRYREMFGLGTAAFVQKRYVDAAKAFEACDAFRPGDRAASVMLRRSRELEGY
jgi:hypothetical protein